MYGTLTSPLHPPQHHPQVKEVLSANSNIPVHVEAVHDDIDLSTQISRVEFEGLCSDLFSRAVAPLDRVLTAANVTLDQVHQTLRQSLGSPIRD